VVCLPDAEKRLMICLAVLTEYRRATHPGPPREGVAGASAPGPGGP